jgi:tetratricopeptide (TPR) repeat protein
MINSGSKFIRKFAQFLTVLCSLVPAFLQAQTADQTYAFALYESRQGNYDIAIKSLKRLQFFDDPNNFPGVFKMIADCYFQQSKYEDAFYYYDLASIQAENDSMLPEIVARKVSCKLYDHQYQEALIELLSFNMDINPVQQWQFDMLFGITYFYLDEYDQSKLYFLKCTDSLQLQQVDNVNEDFRHIKHIEKRFNPKTVRVMSILIPGAGQFWVGDYRNGVNSLLLVTGLLAAGATLSGSIALFDSLVIIGPWFQRYYTGGYQRAYKIAEARQKEEKNKVLAQLVKMLDQSSAR